MRIGILGPESTGKTTLSEVLAREKGFTLVPEYARAWVESHPEGYTYEDVETIAKHQAEEYEANADAVFDTEMIITKVWFLVKYGHCPQWVEEFVKTKKMDEYLLCYPDIPWVEDVARENGSQQMREHLFEIYKNELEAIGAHYTIVRHN